MAKFLVTPLTGDHDVITARLGAGTGSANNLTDKEVGKFVKLVGESRYNLAAVGDEIEGFIDAIETATQDGYTIGSVCVEAEFKGVTFDGAQGTPGTGNIAVGDYVVVGTPVAKDTALVVGTPAKVCKATDQTAAKNSPFACRVISLGSAGTGAPGTTGVIQLLR